MRKTRHGFRDNDRLQERQNDLAMYGFWCPQMCPRAWRTWNMKGRGRKLGQKRKPPASKLVMTSTLWSTLRGLLEKGEEPLCLASRGWGSSIRLDPLGQLLVVRRNGGG